MSATAGAKVSYDLHPSEELRDAYNFNVSSIFYTWIFSILLPVNYRSWKVFAVVLFATYLPLIANIVWLLVPFRFKRKVLLNNCVALYFYT